MSALEIKPTINIIITLFKLGRVNILPNITGILFLIDKQTIFNLNLRFIICFLIILKRDLFSDKIIEHKLYLQYTVCLLTYLKRDVFSSKTIDYTYYSIIILDLLLVYFF